MVSRDTKVAIAAFIIFIFVLGLLVLNDVVGRSKSTEGFTLRKQYRMITPLSEGYDRQHKYYKDNAMGSCYYYSVEPRDRRVRENGSCACTNESKKDCVKCCRERVKCRKDFEISADADIYTVNNPDRSLVHLQDCITSCSQDRNQLCYG